MATLHLTDDTFENEVINSKGSVVVDFFAPWCGPCKMLAPVIDQLAESYDGKVKICKVDIDENQRVTNNFRVQSVPTIVFFKDGKEIGRSSGYRDFDDMSELIDNNLI